ncbi:vacuolar type ATP synthase subunit [Deinococcus arenae]|uniref:Vacuolar type ATP synthase subunit n=1 Tax=Deinococcus arenae TaxID=1452751 RepID=A0A8H9GRD6_9DEIO|nr:MULTISPECIES: V-type ATPase subunit subunit G family protein [Deinococcus]AWT36868.1 V-type ATP synthase subunit H [Deinococcus actinosclerus]GGM49586.1 vacuolar type ATP synthase subunit [Deinococcus arenae]
MDVSSRVLSELASREAALDAQIETARAQAQETVDAAQAQAASILRDAEARVKAMQAEQDQQLARDVQQVREEASVSAQTQAQAIRARAEAKLGEAVDTIMRAVLP